MSMSFDRLLCKLAAVSPGSIRKWIYKGLGICSTTSEVRSNVFIDNPKQVKIGRNSFVNHHVQFNVGASNSVTITIGENCWIGPNVNFVCVSHEIGNHEKRAAKNTYKSIVIDDGCWIGANAIILGANVGAGSIVGAGTIVTNDIPCDELWTGQKAEKLKILQ